MPVHNKIIRSSCHNKKHLHALPGDVLGNLVAKALIGTLVLLGAREHLLRVLSHGLLVVTVAVSSRGVVLQHTRRDSEVHQYAQGGVSDKRWRA